MKTTIFLWGLLSLILFSNAQPLSLIDRVPYDENPPTPQKAFLESLSKISYNELEVKEKWLEKGKKIRIHSLRGVLFSGWAYQVFTDTDHRYRYTKIEQGLAVWQIGYFDNGDLDHDFHMKAGYNKGSQRMWRKGGKPYIQTYFLEGGISHGPQLRWHANGQLARDALYEKGIALYDVILSPDGKVVEFKGEIPAKYRSQLKRLR